MTSTPRLQQKWWVVFEGGGVGGSNGFSVTAVLLMSPELRRVGEELTLVSAGHRCPSLRHTCFLRYPDESFEAAKLLGSSSSCSCVNAPPSSSLSVVHVLLLGV